jgi:lambda family phage tail tape measure protein
MAELASLQIKVVRDGIEQAQKALSDLAKAADKAEKDVDKFGKKSEETNRKTKTFGDEITGLAKKAGALYIAKQFGDIAIEALKASAAMEQQKVAFTTMLGSAERANSLLRDMQEFAGSTPFSFNEVVDAGKRLVAFGFEADSVVGNLRMLGDVAAGLSQPVGDMVYLFGQIKTQGRAMTQDLMQFANRGVPIYDELAKVLGVSTSQVKEFASQGKIGFKEIEQVFKNMSSEGGKFAGLMDAQSKTLSGKWSNFGDNLDRIAVTLGDKLAPAASSVLDLLIRMTESDMSKNEREMDDIVKKATEMIDLEKKFGNDAMNKSYYKDELLYLEKMKGITIPLNATASERLAIYKKISEVSEAEAAAMGLISSRGKEFSLYMEKTMAPVMKLVNEFNAKNKPDKKNEDLKPTGSGTPQWMKDQQYLQNILKSSGAEIDQINAKYGEQLEKINKIKQSWGENTNTHKMAVETEKAVIESKNKAMYEAETRLASFDSVVKKSLTTGLISALEITSLKGKKAAAVIGDLLTDIGGAAISAGMQAFEKLGYSLGQGASGFKALSSALADFADMLLKTLPMMFVQAGLMAIANGNMGLGLTFVGIGLSGAVVNGFREGMKAKKDQESQSSTTNAAQGAVFGFAKGGSFTNEIINSPTRFAFAKGGGMASGLMGEAGIEGVVPLKRMSNGNLGVESSGGGNVNINIINGSGEKVDVQEKTSPGGTTDITVTIGAIVNKQLVEGSYDRAMKYRYGIGQKGV